MLLKHKSSRLRSRFEVDLNRPREKAVYVTPDDCWGLDVWKEKPSPRNHRTLACRIRRLLLADQKIFSPKREEKHGKFVLYDIHSYNHKRNGADARARIRRRKPGSKYRNGNARPRKMGYV